MKESLFPEYQRHLAEEWGSRAEALLSALLQEHRKIPRANGFQSAGLKPTYHMDPASLLPALALDAGPGQVVLDLCAAPGGKTLVLAESIFLESSELKENQSSKSNELKLGRLVANEISDSRRTRLKNTIREYVQPEFSSQIRVTGYDASRWGLKEKEVYDRILIDAPCSGDRFFLKKLSQQKIHDLDGEDTEDYRPGRSKKLAVRQYAILASAWMALRRGGQLVYSTCAVSAVENDKVIEKLIKRQGKSNSGDVCLEVQRDLSPGVQIIASKLEMVCEPTVYGFIILPDRSIGAGPMYFSLLRKL